MTRIVAIDGPAGAGKSTVARRVADALGYTYIDTGAIYRSLGLVAKRLGVSWRDSTALARLAAELQVQFVDIAGRKHVFINGQDETKSIRSPDISHLASAVGQYGIVRDALLAQQRQLGVTANPGTVLEGRDIGTVVFPDAFLKIFLTASDEERARRRLQEIESQGITDLSLENVLSSIQERDLRDEQREAAPLKKADDAIVVDSTGRTLSDIVEQIVALANERKSP